MLKSIAALCVFYLTDDLGTLPRIVMYLLAFSFATRIICLGAIVLLLMWRWSGRRESGSGFIRFTEIRMAGDTVVGLCSLLERKRVLYLAGRLKKLRRSLRLSWRQAVDTLAIWTRIPANCKVILVLAVCHPDDAAVGKESKRVCVHY